MLLKKGIGLHNHGIAGKTAMLHSKTGLIRLIVLFLSLSCSAVVEASLASKEEILRKAIRSERNDSIRMIRMFSLAYFYQDVQERHDAADSISEMALRIADMSNRHDLLLLAYNLYIESNDPLRNYLKCVSYGEKALQLCRISTDSLMEWRSCINLSKVFQERMEYAVASEYANRALSLANGLRRQDLRLESELAVGKALEGKNMKIEAFRHFLAAEDLAVRLDSMRLLIKCYGRLAGFYNLNRLFDDAVRYKLKQAELIGKLRPIDSVAVMFAQYELQSIYSRMPNRMITESSFRNIIGFAMRNGHVRLKNWEFAVYRKYLIETDRIEALYQLYYREFPEELDRIRAQDRTMFYRLMAFFKEVEKKPDSAYHYLLLAEKEIRSDPNLILQSTFYTRFGQFLVRRGNDREAIQKFRTAFRLADSSGYFGKFDFMMAAGSPLEKLYEKTNDFRNAYHFSSINREISDSISALSKKEQVVLMEINQEAQKRERIAAQEKQRIERVVRQRKNERNMLAGGVLFTLVITVVIFRNYRNQKRLNRLLDEQKRKSDELLHNILPHETAEELKRYGSAKAQRFREVTVMFTDFKDFTQASEQLGAEELVKTIHFYFSEFDRIIGNHRLEKIKIIGDSYMCAGGIPVANETHAEDVVRAALDLQTFAIATRKEKAGKGERYFELRIGIHTGPVVAGIVGTRKFAYDIWGDTVNTASRMESTGEVDKVNISGATYEKVRHRFQCHYRGKVNAKNKGEIDMYFVENPSGTP